MNKATFIGILSETNRKGIDQVLAKLEELGVFEAPTSSRFHLFYKGRSGTIVLFVFI